MSDTLWSNTIKVEEEQAAIALPLITVKTPTTMRDALLNHFSPKIIHNPALDRTIVSFQANKQSPFYNWFKYREGFSHQLVHYLLKKVMPQPGTLLDPFAGGGSALFAASELGWNTEGIEVLPVGIYSMQARTVAKHIDVEAFTQAVNDMLFLDFAAHYDSQYAFNHIAITRGAYPDGKEQQLIGYISYCNHHVANQEIRTLLLYASFCILEDMSFTRKDGQYLRWDKRSGRSQGKRPFDKGRIYTFREAIESKLHQMVNDLRGGLEQSSFFLDEDVRDAVSGSRLDIRSGSCLDLLPMMPANSINFVLTSPPYANRYDYTRTYALELVYLGCGDEEVKRLRQMMLSCTVENKDKRAQIERYYIGLDRADDFNRIDETFNQQGALQEVLSILEDYRDAGALNNPHIARLVHHYFYEMCFVIYELSRLLQAGGIVAMVNDNVRYAGEEVPVDLILSHMAETFGLTTRYIWTLGRGKGNSSQQMGNHGRTELRKCVYIWEKNEHC